MKRTFSAFLFLLFSCRLVSQTETTISMLTVNDGLSQGMIFDLMQSRDGFIWIATKDGLNRYDGIRFKIFSPDPFNPYAIGGSEVQSLFEDSRGWIWIKLPGRLDVFNPADGRFFHLTHDGKAIDLVSIDETPDGALWLSDGTQLLKVTPPKDLLEDAVKQGKANIELPCKAIKVETGVSGQVGQLHFTPGKNLLVHTSLGLFRLDPGSEQLQPEMPALDHLDWLVESPNGEIILKGTKAGATFLGRIKPGENVLTDVKNSTVPEYSNNIAIDHNGYFWTYSPADKSIRKWQSSSYFNQGKPKLSIPATVLRLEKNQGYGCTTFMVDKSGIIWVGTSGYGIVKINEKGQKFKTALPRTAHNLLYEAPNGTFFTKVLPDQKFLSPFFDRSVPQSELPLLEFNGHRFLTFDPAGNVWWLHKNQLHRMDAATKTKTSFPFEGLALLYDRNGKLLSVDEKGLHQFDPNTHTSRDFPFEQPQKTLLGHSNFLYEDCDGVIWIFGFEGLIKATPGPAGYNFALYLNNPLDRNSLSSNTILSVVDDPLEPRRYLWAGAKGGGLNRLDKQSGTFKQYNTAQGLPDNVVYGILAEDHAPFIWLSTNKGLCRFDVRAETTKNFTIADGLQDNEFNSAGYLKTKNGYLIFAGVNGINVFHPDSLYFNPNLPQTHIVGFQVNNQAVDIAGQSTISLAYHQNLLNFDFAALEFSNPAQNQYRYQLVGVDKDWVSIGNKNSIQFANLAPGTYTFRVIGSNNDGAWSEQPAELHFVIHPPWWASWWAYIFYLALLVGGIWRYYQYQLRRRFSEQEKLRLQELDDFKSRFFTNITHEFRTPLTVMLGMSEQLAKAEKEEPNLNKIGLIKRSGENLLRLVNQILDLAKLESNTLKMNYIQGDVLTFIRYVAESLHSLANAQNLMLRVESDQVKIVMDYDPERLLQIVHNLLSNAIKFTPSGGKVVLQANLMEHRLHLKVSDTGAGIPPEELPHLFERFFQAKNQEYAKAGGTGIGLSLTRELVRAMGGEISVESSPGQGSTFLVTLPVTNNSAFEEKPIQIHTTPIPKPPDSSNHPDKPDILLIEDNPDVVEYLNACLQEVFNLDFAYNGKAGIEKALETVPDLIVSDVMMPFKDGLEVLEALKNDERSSHIPIILLTAKADVQSRLAGLRKGADAYLSKPFHQEELLVTVDNLLETRRKLQLKYQQQVLAEAAPETSMEMEDVFLQKVRAIIDAHYANEDFGLPQLCQKIGLSRSQLFRKMKALTDIAPSDLIRSHRLNKAKALLESGEVNVAEAAWQVGFKDPSYFSKLYQEEFGEVPSSALR